jgi:hypothetical protein
MPTVTYKNTEYVIPEIPLAPSYVVARAGPIFVARNGRTGQYQFVDEDPYRVLIQCKEELKKTEGGMILLKAGEYVLSKTFPDEDIRDKVLVTGEGRSTVVKAPSGVSPFNPNWVRLDNLVWYDEAGKEHDETLVVVTEISDGSITPTKLSSVNSPAEGLAPTYDSTTGKFIWKTAAGISKLSELQIDVDKDWGGKTIKNLGSPIDSNDALRLAEMNSHKTAIPIDHPDGSITNDKIADGTIDLTQKCTYVPVNKAGDTMTGDLSIDKTTPAISLKVGGVEKVSYKVDTVLGMLMPVIDIPFPGMLIHRVPAGVGSSYLFMDDRGVLGGMWIDPGGASLRIGGILGGPIISVDIAGSGGYGLAIEKTRIRVNLPLSLQTSEPSFLYPGLFWFRSDLGRLRFSPDGTTVKEFVHRDGDTMTGDLVIEKDTPILFLKGTSPQIQISEGETLRFVDSLGRGLLDVSIGEVLVWNELNMGGNTISNINDVVASGSYRGGANVDQHWIPSTDAIYDLGSSTTRWKTLYALNTVIGDLGFSEDACPLCGKEFQVGDEVVLKVVGKEGGIKTRPCHKSCPP